MGIIKAHCPKRDKWFIIETNESGQVVNFEGVTIESAKAKQTKVQGTSFVSGGMLRPCMRCGSRKVGCCSHVEQWGCCGHPYFYQCLYCDQLRISLEAGNNRYSEFMGQSNIVGADLDKFGNPLGEQYDLAKREGFRGFRIVMLCLYKGFATGKGEHRTFMACSPPALKEKGFDITVVNLKDHWFFNGNGTVNAVQLKKVLEGSCQLWIISGKRQSLGKDALAVIVDYYKQGHGLYLWGDNDPFHVDVDLLGKELFGVTMVGNYVGDKNVGIKYGTSAGGIIPGHPIATGIVHIYEGITIAAVQTNKDVKPLVYSSDGNVVTAYSEKFGSRLLFDGGFTRLYCKWNTAGTGRFVTNCAAWLANDKSGEICFS